MLRRRILMPALVLTVACAGAFVLIATAPPVESVSPEKLLPIVRVIDVRPSSRRLWVRTQGTVAPRTESQVVPEVSGPVVWMSPSLVSGGFFARGEPLLRIDARDYEADVARARAEVARAEGEWEHADAELSRQRGLSKRNVASTSQLSNARRVARVAKASLEAARVSLDQAVRNVARTEITAPFDGRVREERVDLGQFVGRGSPIATVYATDFAEIRLPIADRQLAYLDLPTLLRGGRGERGPEVQLHARFAGADHAWVGEVVRTEGEIDPHSRMVHVVARVEDPYGMRADSTSKPEPVASPETDQRQPPVAYVPLAVGLFVEAEIAGPVAEDVIALPRAAIRDQDRILLVDAANRLRSRAVEVLRIDRDEVLIRTVLDAGDRICVSAVQVFVEGMPGRPMAGDPRVAS